MTGADCTLCDASSIEAFSRRWSFDLTTPPAQREPILIYQMGKVGSRAVFDTLDRMQELPPAIYHYHALVGLDDIERSLLALPAPPPRALEHVREAQNVRRSYLAGEPAHWKIITLVRDPVARHLSSFFHDITRYAPDFYGRPPSTAELCEVFLERFDHVTPLRWFELQFAPLFGLDVYASSFTREQGYQIHHQQRFDLLVIRAEDLDRHLETALASFLGISGLAPRRVNTGDDKPYAAAYRALRAEVVLPADYLDRQYRSRLARHFYSNDELSRFHAAWERR
jgi:hypothetical protein